MISSKQIGRGRLQKLRTKAMWNFIAILIAQLLRFCSTFGPARTKGTLVPSGTRKCVDSKSPRAGRAVFHESQLSEGPGKRAYRRSGIWPQVIEALFR